MTLTTGTESRVSPHSPTINGRSALVLVVAFTATGDCAIARQHRVGDEDRREVPHCTGTGGLGERSFSCERGPEGTATGTNAKRRTWSDRDRAARWRMVKRLHLAKLKEVTPTITEPAR